MEILEKNDIAMHEAGHVLICYLMNDLVELYNVTIDEELSKTIDDHSDGGVLFKYLKHPGNLNYLELDQFCLFNLAGLAADIVNENNGKVNEEYFFSEKFLLKINHYYYQGDISAFNRSFIQFENILKVTPQIYNYITISLLVNIFAETNILEILLKTREIIESNKTIKGETLTHFLDKTYIKGYRCNYWKNVKNIRKNLFDI
ncbi:hypothetical protein [uncultured Chryseobacterium sp.]|uniref:hypothetical protein n=1 Tax=uncultured Chryseobacterium sp. TaxID=259322 RepID=UPI0025FBF607|nr:hypothetical protein [uncultured Chryseobacterium sp.]